MDPSTAEYLPTENVICEKASMNPSTEYLPTENMVRENSNSVLKHLIDLNDRFYNVGAILCVLSIICLIIHFYKFCRSGVYIQSLVIKNFTFYCFFLFLNYICFLTLFLSSKEGLSMIHGNFIADAHAYTFIAVAFLKLIMAVDLCFNFRNVYLYLQRPDLDPQNKKFFLYCVLGTTIPLLYTSFLVVFFRNDNSLVEFFICIVLRILRVSRLIPVFFTIRYIKISSLDKATLQFKFALHLRLLIMLGGFAAVWSIFELYSCIIQFSKNNPQTHDETAIVTPSEFELLLISVSTLFTLIEGFIIAIFFTFKKDMFRTTHISSSQFQSQFRNQDIIRERSKQDF